MKRTISSIVVAFVLMIPSVEAANITAIWANDGGDKVTQGELRATQQNTVTNTVWDGHRIMVFGGKNEVVAFNVILEAAKADASGVSVSFSHLQGPSGASIVTTGKDIFNWTQRPIELFYIRYLQIKGLSLVSYGTYDERQIPKRFQRPNGQGGWKDRPDHDAYYPEIAVPLELVPTFTIAGGHNQSIWVDIYIPKTAPVGVFKGDLTVSENGTITQTVPVELRVCNVTLPDNPTEKTMLYFSSLNITKRYLGPSGDQTRAQLIRDRHFMIAHRHRISLIGDDAADCNNTSDAPCPEWVPRLDGSLFTAANGYDGPGVNTGNNVYSIGTYGGWTWHSGGQSAMNQHTDAWADWFSQNSPNTEYFLYLIDESPNIAQTEMWAQWIASNSGPGHRVRSMATIDLPTAASQCSDLDIPTSTLSTGISQQWEGPAESYSHDSRKRFWVYNGHRPGTGSFATDDDGTALRELAWAQFKKHINRWFFWESTYYNNYQGGMGDTDVFQTAQTFGGSSRVDPILGETGWNYSNGDGVLFYPGTDQLFPGDSYGVAGPFASIRLKEWRRGIQDAEYLALAAASNPGAVQALVNKMVPKALWDYGVTDPSDPSYVLSDISWNPDPNAWEQARAQTISLITGSNPIQAAPSAVATGSDLSQVKVFPNPWRKDQDNGSPVTFSNLPLGSTVKVFTVSSHLVRTLAANGTSASWDLKNDSGENAASGIYFYLVTAPDGNQMKGKMALIR